MWVWHVSGNWRLTREQLYVVIVGETVIRQEAQKVRKPFLTMRGVCVHVR